MQSRIEKDVRHLALLPAVVGGKMAVLAAFGADVVSLAPGCLLGKRRSIRRKLPRGERACESAYEHRNFRDVENPSQLRSEFRVVHRDLCSPQDTEARVASATSSILPFASRSHRYSVALRFAFPRRI